MPSFKYKNQYSRYRSYSNLKDKCKIYPIPVDRLKDIQQNKFQTQKVATTREKQPSKLVISILAIATITLSVFTINELSKIITSIIKTVVVKEAIQNNQKDQINTTSIGE